MFEVPSASPPAHRRRADRTERLWTGNKALLIERYLYYFVLVTKHGTYIDGFAGPQYPDQPASWAARMVLETEPPWLRHFFLFELDEEKLGHLQRLQAEHSTRDVRLFAGDFNNKVDEILRPEVLKPSEATFCLLDQQTFECEWVTVARVAGYKANGFKVEIFYFLAQGWFDRAIAGSTTVEGRARIERWWGRPDWAWLKNLGGLERAEELARRFREELGYRSAVPYAIYERRGGGRVMYYMVHCSDHPDAPALMDRAYEHAVQPRERLDQLTLEDLRGSAN